MNNTWFVVLSQSAMKIFARDYESGALKHVETVKNPLAHLRAQEMSAHTLGEAQHPGAVRSHSAYEPKHLPQESASLDFARTVSEYLAKARQEGRFEDLQIAAEPGFLGVVKGELSKETLRVVSQWLHKDLEKANTPKLEVAFQPHRVEAAIRP